MVREVTQSLHELNYYGNSVANVCPKHSRNREDKMHLKGRFRYFLFMKLPPISYISTRGNVMFSKKKWMFAFVFVMLFFMLYKFENNDVLSTSYSTSLLEPQKPSDIYKKVVSWFTNSEDLINVSAPITSPPLIEYKSIQPFEDGAILSIEDSQDLYASENGLIIFTGYTKKTGKTLSILYDTGETATFGFVKEFHQLPYTTINAGDAFASADNEILYIKVEKDRKNLDTNELVGWLAETYEQ